MTINYTFAKIENKHLKNEKAMKKEKMPERQMN